MCLYIYIYKCECLCVCLCVSMCVLRVFQEMYYTNVLDNKVCICTILLLSWPWYLAPHKMYYVFIDTNYLETLHADGITCVYIYIYIYIYVRASAWSSLCHLYIIVMYRPGCASLYRNNIRLLESDRNHCVL